MEYLKTKTLVIELKKELKKLNPFSDLGYELRVLLNEAEVKLMMHELFQKTKGGAS